MRTKIGLLTAVAVLVCLISFTWLSASLKGGEKTIEVGSQINIPEYKTDAARAIDAYERLMDRFMDLSDKSLNWLNVDLKSVDRKLDSIAAEIKELSARMARIEKALKIEEPKPSNKSDSQPQNTENKE